MLRGTEFFYTEAKFLENLHDIKISNDYYACLPTISVITNISEGRSIMFLLYDCNEYSHEFDTTLELKEYIENRHAEEGGFDWISEIKDDKGNYYGCSWKLEIEEI